MQSLPFVFVCLLWDKLLLELHPSFFRQLLERHSEIDSFNPLHKRKNIPFLPAPKTDVGTALGAYIKGSRTLFVEGALGPKVAPYSLQLDIAAHYLVYRELVFYLLHWGIHKFL